MPRAFYKNTSTVPLAGKLPGQVFQIEVDADGAPTEVYWRKRLAEGVVAKHVKQQTAPSPAAPTGVASDVEAPPKKTVKKGA